MYFYKSFCNIILLLTRFYRLCNISLYLKNNIILSTPKLTNYKNKKLNNILTWNIQELFLYSSKNKLQNICYIINHFDTDVVCLQECFEDFSKKYIIKNLTSKYPFYIYGNICKKYLFCEDSGLMVFSKYPIENVSQYTFTNFTGIDRFANKGALFFRISNYNFVNTHLQSSNTYIASKQYTEILNNSPFKNNFILIGDLNINDFTKKLHYEKNNSLHTHESNNIYDYIISVDKSVLFSSSVKYFTNLSDHYPLIAEIL